ncbi:MAG: rubredoxin, partial [Candidatus Methanomethylophilus sp.]|nr:rubredoxin [Methanomethylophilus sp.]
MAKYQCSICGEIYDEDIEKVKFDDLPDDWVCPLCRSPKSAFVLMGGEKKQAPKTE